MHLCVAWPNDLKAWDVREDLARAYEIDGAPKDKAAHRYPHPLASIFTFHIERSDHGYRK